MEKYIEEYNIYQRMKNKTEAPAEKLKLSEIPEKLWTYLLVDFITKLPLITRKDAILVVYNKLFKITHFVTITEELVMWCWTENHSLQQSWLKRTNQELEQYLRLFIDHRQKDWPEWLVSAEFAVNNKTHSAIKMSLFIANYGRKLRMGAEIRKKEKVEKVIEFAERMKKIQEETGAMLIK